MKLLPNINKNVPESTDPAQIKPVSDALEALDTALGAKPSTLNTTAKTIVPAINEIHANNSLRQAGLAKVPILALNTSSNVDVTLSVPFPDQNYIVAVTQVGGGLDGSLGWAVLSNSQFRIYGKRSTAVVDMDVSWIAQKRTQ